MADPALLGPLGEAHLGDQPGLDPVVAAAAGRAGIERRPGARERLQAVPHAAQGGLVEAGADLAGIDEAVTVVDPHVQRAEPPARALRLRPAADDELLAEVALDLQPLARASADVAAVGALGDDALQPLLGGRLVERLAATFHVLAGADHAARRQQQREAGLALRQGDVAQVVPVEREGVEEDRAHRHRRAGALDVGRPGEVHAVLQALERRPPPLVERHDLAVEDEAPERQRAQRGDDLRIAPGEHLPGPTVELDALAVAGGQHAHAVVLDLEEPVRPRERPLGQRGQHDGLASGVHRARRRPGAREARAQRGQARRAGAHLLDGQAGQHRLRKALGRLVGAGESVGLLEQQPVLRRAAHARERPAPAQLDPEELDVEPAGAQLLGRRGALQQAVPAAIPHDDGAGAVVAVGDDALEVGVLDRVVLDVHGQALFLRAQRRPLGHRPALQHAVHLEAQVVVQPAGGVLLDDEEAPVLDAGRAGRPRPRAERLGRALGIALLSVVVEGGGHNP